MSNELEKILQKNIGKYIGIHYIVQHEDTPDNIYGHLKEVTEDYIKICTTGFSKSTHFINRKAVQILEIITKCEE